jgi:hypothetical protein
MACHAGGKVIETWVPVSPAKASVAGDDLPAVLVSPAVARPEDFSTDRATSTLEQPPYAAEDTDLQLVCGVRAP